MAACYDRIVRRYGVWRASSGSGGSGGGGGGSSFRSGNGGGRVVSASTGYTALNVITDSSVRGFAEAVRRDLSAFECLRVPSSAL